MTARTYHRGQHRSRGEIAPCCLGRLDENTRTRLHERALEVHTFSQRFAGVMAGFTRCAWSACPVSATVQVGSVSLCPDHATRRIARRLWDLQIAAEVDFHPLQDEVA